MSESLAISFIDGGDARGSFSWSLANAIIKLKNEINISHVLRASGGNVPMNRWRALDDFIKNTDADWFLSIDSDIVFEPYHIQQLWDTKSEQIQVVTGVYFLLGQRTNIVPFLLPAIFDLTDKAKYDNDEHKKDFYHPFPENKIVEISRAGFGFLLLSRKVIERVLSEIKGSPFQEIHRSVDEFVGEDFIFFSNLEKLGIKSYANTGIIVNHEKHIQITQDLYRFFYQVIQPVIASQNA